MGKLHELLAVEGDLRAASQRALSQAQHTFTEGKGRLLGQVRRYHPRSDNEPLADESKPLHTTVDATLEQVKEAFGSLVDAAVQKEVTNQGTAATVTVDGMDVFGEELPATALLNLESKLAELRGTLKLIPVNDPGMTWGPDEDRGCYVSEERVTYTTKKVPKAQVLYEATPEHPAQVEQYFEDVISGEWHTTLLSGGWTPARRKEVLDKLDELARAVKKARQRANDIEAEKVEVAEAIFAFIGV